MCENIIGTLRSPYKKRWILISYDIYHCVAETTDGQRFILQYKGNGNKRVYSILNSDGMILAQSQPISAKGWRAFKELVDRHVIFLDCASEKPIMEYRRYGDMLLRFGSMDIACTYHHPKWSRQVFESDYFRFETNFLKTEVKFLIKNPDFFLASLCAGYVDYVTWRDS